MHIPSATIAEQAVLPFEQALSFAEQPQDAYDHNRWLYVPPRYGDYRYLLGTKGAQPLICVGINPSTAAPDALDNTLKSVARIAAANGFTSWMMMNVYAQRATRPDDMDQEISETLHSENMKAFRYLLAHTEPPVSIWAAWGAIIEKRGYLRNCVQEMAKTAAEYGATWYCAGRSSKAGHPHHPLYLAKDEPLRPFDIDGYLNR